jgi:alpha-tubulin suppressor-like RCC1 family protein
MRKFLKLKTGDHHHRILLITQQTFLTRNLNTNSILLLPINTSSSSAAAAGGGYYEDKAISIGGIASEYYNNKDKAISSGIAALGVAIVAGLGIGWAFKSGNHNNNNKKPSEINTTTTTTTKRKNTIIQLYAVGENKFGTLGLGDETDRFSPELVQLEEEPIAVAAAAKSSAVITKSGQVWTFGYATDYRLGSGIDLLSQNSPSKITMNNSNSNSGEISPIQSVTLGEFGGLLISQVGKLFAFGRNLRGENGIGIDISHSPKPTPVIMTPEVHGKIISASRGRTHSAFVDSSGNLFLCGSLAGLNSNIPMRIEFPQSGVEIEQVACGRDFILALDSHGRVWGMGSDESGALSLGSYQRKIQTPHLVKMLEPNVIVQVAAGDTHSGVVDSKGKLYLCGSGGDYRLGTGKTEDVAYFTHIPLPGKVKKLSLGGGHSAVVLAEDSSLWIWGRGKSGQLARRVDKNEAVTSSGLVPQRSGFFQGKKVVDVALGGDHTLVLVMEEVEK